MSADLARDTSGSAAVEFAIVAPVFLALTFGVFQLGWQFHCAASTRYALERSARELTMNTTMTASQLQSRVTSQLEAIASTNVAVSLTRQTTADGPVAIATATYTGRLDVPLLASYPISFRSTVTVPTTPPT